MSLQIIILAAGQGKRMYSSTPKVLHKIAGKPMLVRVVETAEQLNPDAIHVVYGHGGEQIKAALLNLPVNWVLQNEQLGTGHAVMQALPHIPSDSQVLILSADVPLIEAETLQNLIDKHRSAPAQANSLSLLLAKFANPTGLGRIVRNAKGDISAIVEEKDATVEQKNTGNIQRHLLCTSG